MTFLRLVTVHPILVHFTIGLIPLMLAAYLLARWLDSERWTFVGDVTLYACALVTLATAAFGLASYFTLDWPGGLSVWRGLHLAFGAATTLVLLGLAGYRIGNRKQRPRGGWPLIAGSATIAVLVAFTGWVGGEVLVYRSGMAVEAAANGALAPALHEPDPEEKLELDSVEDAMHALRGNWAAIATETAEMIVEHPAPDAFERIDRHAQRVARVASWVASRESHESTPEERPATSMRGDVAAVLATAEGAPPAQADDADDIARMAHDLATEANALAAAARTQDVVAVTAAVGRVSTACANCHAEHRWRGTEE